MRNLFILLLLIYSCGQSEKEYQDYCDKDISHTRYTLIELNNGNFVLFEDSIIQVKPIFKEYDTCYLKSIALKRWGLEFKHGDPFELKFQIK